MIVLANPDVSSGFFIAIHYKKSKFIHQKDHDDRGVFVEFLSPIHQIEAELQKSIKKIYSVSIDEKNMRLEPTPDTEFGNLGFGCFPLAKLLKKSPVFIAQDLANQNLAVPFVDSFQAAGPYLNIKLNASVFIEVVYSTIMELKDSYGTLQAFPKQNILIEYSAPNTNKPQHLGHIRNNVLGMAVANVLEAAGNDVARVNLVNDRGIHICKSMLAYSKWGNEDSPNKSGKKGDHFVGDYYVMFEQKAKENPDLLNEAQEMLKKWENGDEEILTLWKKMNDWVYRGFDETYTRLGCRFDKVYHESDTYREGRDIVLRGLENNFLKKNDVGDIVADLSGIDLDEKVLLRNDGTSIYITQDLGTAIQKFNDFNVDKSVYVVASEQNLHFKILFYVLRILGYEWAEKCYHLNYGMVYLPEGKLKSREGKVVDADTLLDELYDLAKKEILDRTRGMEEDELEYTSEAVALSALKYYMLKTNPQKDIHFVHEESLSFDGATGPFAQYSYARLSSILRKGKDLLSENVTDFTVLGNTEELNLALCLSLYPDVIRDAAESLNPARIAAWIFDAARAINKFHREHLVLNPDDKTLTAARGGLVRIARQVLGTSLRQLGIIPLERM